MTFENSNDNEIEMMDLNEENVPNNINNNSKTNQKSNKKTYAIHPPSSRNKKKRVIKSKKKGKMPNKKEQSQKTPQLTKEGEEFSNEGFFIEEAHSEKSNQDLANDATDTQNITQNDNEQNSGNSNNERDSDKINFISNSRKYLLHRDKKLTRTVIQWSLLYEGNVIYSAKSKGPFNPTIIIQEGTEVHYSSPNPDFVILTSHQRIYTLFEKEKNGKQLASIEFTSNFEDSMRPRSLDIKITSPNIILHNMEPTYNSIHQSWQLNFNGKFTQRSIKNFILLDDAERVCIILRKFADNDLEIESFIDNFPHYLIFAIAICDFLCTVE